VCAADWLVSEEVTAALTRIKRESEQEAEEAEEAEEAGCCDCCGVSLVNEAPCYGYGMLLCSDCGADRFE
jgi:hypothetical protein